MNKKYIFFLMFIPFYTSPTIIWNNIMTTGTANASDQDVQINGDTWLPAEIVTIEAINQDVTISMLNGPHTVYGTTDGSDSTVLVLYAVFPWTITIQVSEDLTFVGVEDDLTIPLIIQERGILADDEYPMIKWFIAEHKNLHFGPSDTANFGGVDLQIVCDGSFNIPQHIFKVNGSSKNPHIFFSRNSSWTVLQETAVGPTPFAQEILFDVSNGEPRNHLAYFKDGSGLLFESRPL